MNKKFVSDARNNLEDIVDTISRIYDKADEVKLRVQVMTFLLATETILIKSILFLERRMKTSPLTMLFAGVLLFAGFSCTDAKEKACEKAYSQINKCLPGYGSKKKMQIRLCRKTFEKSYTQGTVNCAQVFSSCDQFKDCLEFSAKVGVFAQEKLARTSEVNEKCKSFEKSEFKKCVKCVFEDKTGQQLNACVKGEDESQEQNTNTPTPVTEKDKIPTPMSPTPATKDSTETTK